MDESERLQRYRREYDKERADEDDAKLADRIASLLNHPAIDKHCVVDAYYYDFSVIPHEIQEKFNFYRDVYLIFGVTTFGEIISKWVERYDLDSSDEIVDGKVIHKESPRGKSTVIPDIPEISQCFDPKLLSTPAPDFIKMFRKSP